MKILFLSILIVLSSLQAFGYIQNRNLFPLGDKEGFLANTSQAVLGSSGSTFFNPSLLNSISSSRISASVTTLAEFTTQVSSFANYDGGDLNFENSGTLTIPNSLVSIYKTEDYTLAFSVFVPELVQLRNIINFETTSSFLDVTQFSDTEDLWFGPSYAQEISEHLNLGLSLLFLRHDFAYQNNLTIYKKDQNNKIQLISQSTNYEKLETLGFIVKGGLWWQLNDVLDIGLSAAFPFSKITGESYIYQLQTNNNVTRINPLKKVDFDYALPLDLQFGFGLRIRENLHLYGDLGYQLATVYQPYPAFSQTLSTRNILRWSYGFDWSFSSNWELLMGYMNNPSSLNLDSNYTQSRENFFGTTFGITYTSGPAKLGVGGFNYSSMGENIVINDPQRKGEIHSHLAGLLISSIFLY